MQRALLDHLPYFCASRPFHLVDSGILLINHESRTGSDRAGGDTFFVYILLEIHFLLLRI
nr:hypothetical protein Q903MT_gene6182 [Picea sitchensis]